MRIWLLECLYRESILPTEFWGTVGVFGSAHAAKEAAQEITPSQIQWFQDVEEDGLLYYMGKQIPTFIHNELYISEWVVSEYEFGQLIHDFQVTRVARND